MIAMGTDTGDADDTDTDNTRVDTCGPAQVASEAVSASNKLCKQADSEG